MNIDATEQSPQQAAQNQQQTHQQDTATVVALLISPSSASSPTSTVSPTASSISKNSSTDEVDETTAEAADLHSSESQPPRDVGQRPNEQPIGERQQPDATLASDHQHVVARQEERYQRSSMAASIPSSMLGTAEEDGAASARAMTFASASCDDGVLETTDHTLLAQCTTVGNVTASASEKDDQPVVTSATAAIDDEVLDSLNKRMASAEITDNDTTTTKTDVVREQELTADTAIPQQSTSSSSSTSSSPGAGTDAAKEVVALADSGLPTATVLAAANNNPMPDEDNEDEQADSSSCSNSSSTDTTSSTSGSSNSTNTSSSSINNNDRFNNNNNNNNTNCSTGHKKEEIESGDIDSGGKVKVGTACDNDSSLRIEKEEGVRTSTATEIAPGQGEGSSSTSSSVTLPNAELSSGTVLVTHEAAPAAPLDRVQILPETMDHSKQEEQQVHAKASEAADHDDNDNDEGVGLSSMTVTAPTVGEVAEENNTISTASSSAIVVAVGVGDGGEGTSLSSPSCSRAPPAAGPLGDGSSSSSTTSVTAATLPSSRSSSPPSSSPSESSPSATVPQQALAEAQQAAPSMADRQLCDSSPKGHSFVVGVVEGQRSKSTEVQAPSSRSPHQSTAIGTEANPLISMHPSTATHLAVVVEDDGGDRDDGTHAPSNSRPLTLAEELSQADAAGSLTSSSSSSSVSPSVVAPGSTSLTAAVVAVLPKSAAGTAVAAVAASSGSSRSTSPILHSSLKKSHRMGFMTGAAVTGPAGAEAAATAVATNEPRRRVSFPKDAQLITGYLDPVNPWACISVCESSELLELYRSSCKRHCTLPLKNVLEHLKSIDNSKGRVPLLSLKDQQLSYGACEALEEIFKHVQYRCIDLSHSGLDDVTASVMFDIIEYYEAANELDISDNLQLSSKSWTACINMLKKSQALNVLITRGPTISDYQATNLAKALNTSAIHTLKLEHCVLSQQPIASLCTMLKRNTVLRELWLAHNQLSCEDAQQIANLLRSNYYIQLIDISNNRIGDKGVDHIVTAIVEQSIYFKDMQEKKRKSDLNFSDLSSSLNSINNGVKNYFPQRIRSSEPIAIATAPHQVVSSDDDMRCTPSAITLTPPVTPPSTPALPAVTTPTGDPADRTDRSEMMETAQISEAGKTATMYTINQHGVGIESKANDTAAPPAPSPPTPPADAVAPPNVNLVQTSTNNSVSLQTSDREKPATVERPTAGGMVTAEEEALLLSSVVVVGERPTEVPSTTGMEEIVQSEQTVAATTLEDESLELLLSLETPSSDSPVPQAPKKARLAKQDSVLSEFEASVAMDITTKDGGKGVESEQKPKHDTNSSSIARQPMPKVAMMEEDAPELCADYDDDGSNLQISQENLFVDLGIPAVCEEEEDVEEIERATGSAAVAAPLKKDELQLLIEKSKKVDADQLETAEVPAKEQNAPQTTIAPPVRVRKSAISSDEREQSPSLSSVPIQAPKKDRSHSSSSDNTVEGGGSAVGVRIVEVEIKDSVPLSRSLDSVGGDESDFESSSPFMTTAPSSFPNERSFSSESLNSETSIDSNDSKSSLKIIESKFAAKNGTLERQQQSNGNRESTGGDQASTAPTGLQVLVLWNNEITRNSMRHFSRLLEKTSTLDTLNVGSNLLCNNFVAGIGAALKANGSLTNLGLQGAHLSDKGAKAMAEVIEFGGNASLQRIDLRNNNIQKAGLEALNEAMKSNKSVTRIDLDDTPRRVKDTSMDGVGSEYSRLVNNIRAQCERNKNPPEPSEPINASVKRARANYLSSRKISLTCPSIKTSPSAISGADKQHLLDPSGCKKTPPGTTTGGGRLRSPLPSPIPSPIASPVPSPSRNRFHVSRVTDAASGGGTGGANPSGSPSPSSTGSSPTLFFPSNSRFRVVTVAEPDLKSANNRNSGSTISLPMSSSKSSPSVSPSMAGSVGSSAMAVHRRPVCSSAPTLSSFPSPLSPLAGVPTTMGVRPMTPSPVPPPPLLPVVMPSNTTFSTSIQPTPLMAAPPMGPSPTMVVPTLVGPTLVNQSMPLQPQILSQPPFQQLPPLAPFAQQHTPPGYHFVTMCRPGSNTPITIQQQQLQQPQPHPSLVMFHQLTKNTAGPQTSIHLQQQQQQQPQQQTQYISAHPPTKVRHSSSSSSHHHLQQHHSSSSNSSTLHDSVLSSTSIESPDLEVKRFMSGGGSGGGGVLDDSCCSSISSSSIDSIDNPHFISTSISSTDESFDLVVSSPPPSGGGSSCSSFSIVPSQTSRPQEEESTLIPSASGGAGGGGGYHLAGKQTAAALEGAGQQPPIASLSTSSIGAQLNTASSQESLYDVHDLSASSNSSLTGTVTVNWAQQGPAAAGIKQHAAPVAHHAAPPIAANVKAAAHLASNSNESTLTSVQSLDREPAKVQPAGEKAPRVRKTSWILGGVGGGTGGGGSKHSDSGSSGGSTPTPSGGGSGYPPAIEKLLSIFHNPFSSSSKASSASPPPHATESSASSGGSQPPSRKESPMGGLFHWAHGSGGAGSNSTSPTTTTKEEVQRLKENVSPETTLTPQQLQPLQNQLHTTGTSVQHQQQSAENMPPQLKVEMKENISPENTITHKLLTAVVPSGEAVVLAASNLATPAIVTPAAAPHTKVIFQLGGDYDESEDDIETLTNKYGNNASLAGVGGQYFGTGGHHQSGPNSLLGGSTTSNSSGISIGSGTSAGGDIPTTMMVPSPTPSGASVVSGQTSVSSDTVLVLSHLGQLARDSLSMFKNPSLTSQDSISVRSMDSLVEMATGGAAAAAAAADTRGHPPSASPLSTVPGHSTQPASASASSPSSLSLGHTASSRSSSPSVDNSSAQ
ncbi:mucin-5AC [Anopheles ziemanni]|uniref:mucin-5AC n=1 Tax=Anopheles coustani TaxID=139045 RepID=UPI00265A3AD4|nr:mucin-5AC [Anopheles coustani]XP_058168878.1 mucin-5AC [Anopheles ziemanni]